MSYLRDRIKKDKRRRVAAHPQRHRVQPCADWDDTCIHFIGKTFDSVAHPAEHSASTENTSQDMNHRPTLIQVHVIKRQMLVKCSSNIKSSVAMVCARCLRWWSGWIHWQYASTSFFLPPDVHCVYARWPGTVSYFYCKPCRKEKHELEGWTPGVYVNEDGGTMTDSDDEEFLWSIADSDTDPATGGS